MCHERQSLLKQQGHQCPRRGDDEPVENVEIKVKGRTEGGNDEGQNDNGGQTLFFGIYIIYGPGTLNPAKEYFRAVKWRYGQKIEQSQNDVERCQIEKKDTADKIIP